VDSFKTLFTDEGGSFSPEAFDRAKKAKLEELQELVASKLLTKEEREKAQKEADAFMEEVNKVMGSEEVVKQQEKLVQAVEELRRVVGVRAAVESNSNTASGDNSVSQLSSSSSSPIEQPSSSSPPSGKQQGQHDVK